MRKIDKEFIARLCQVGAVGLIAVSEYLAPTPKPKRRKSINGSANRNKRQG